MRRYGFHGLSYAYLLSELARTAGPDEAAGRVILAHLGSGASLAAVRGGRCIDTSMGLTPAGGLVMGSRTGDLDPGVITHILRSQSLSADALDRLLTHDAGLKAISGGPESMADLLRLEAHDARARLAVEIFCYQVSKWIGAFAAALAGLDTLVFSGGIGEHADVIRARVCAPLAHLGITLDAGHNAAHAAVISTPETAVTVRVIPTDEALMMVQTSRVPARQRALHGVVMSDPASRTESLRAVDAYWRAANYLSVGQIYLLDNPLLREPLQAAHVKPRLLGHWGTTPGQNFIYAHLNRVIAAT